MALPLGKLVILAGAGLIGASTIYAKDSGISDWLSGATGILKHLKQDAGSKKTPQNDSLMAQVNNLRQELQMLASNRPVTIITSGGAGANKYYIIVVVGVIGYGYVWWKGWKLPDMMFATRRTLSDACNSVAQQLETVYASVRTTKKELSADISNLDAKLMEVEEITNNTQGVIVELRERSENISSQFRFFETAVESLGSRVDQLAMNQAPLLSGVDELLVFARDTQAGLIEDNQQTLPSISSQIQFSPRMALPAAADVPSPPPPMPAAASGSSPEVQRTPRRVLSLPSAQQGNGIAGVAELTGQDIWKGISTPELRNNNNNNRGAESCSSSSSALQRPSSFFSRTVSSVAGTVLKRAGLKQ